MSSLQGNWYTQSFSYNINVYSDNTTEGKGNDNTLEG